MSDKAPEPLPPSACPKKRYEPPAVLEEEVFERSALQAEGKIDPFSCGDGPYTS